MDRLELKFFRFMSLFMQDNGSDETTGVSENNSCCINSYILRGLLRNL